MKFKSKTHGIEHTNTSKMSAMDYINHELMDGGFAVDIDDILKLKKSYEKSEIFTS